MRSSLPPNATPFEQRIEQTIDKRMAPILAAADSIKHLWNAETCPAEALPFLAYGLRVRVWDPNWTVETQRSVIASWLINRLKRGTRAAVPRALEAIAVNVDRKYWYEQTPPGPRGTSIIKANINANVSDDIAVITTERREQIKQTIETNKRGSHHFSLRINSQHDASMASLVLFSLRKKISIRVL